MRNSKAKKSFIVFLSFLLLFMAASCKSSGTGPEEKPKDSRNYTWTVDSLKKIAPNGIFHTLWGTSPDDLWCLSVIGEADKLMLHYKNKKWEGTENITTGGLIFPHSIFGLTSNELWIGGEDGDIWKLVNGSYTKYGIFKMEGIDPWFFNYIWGASQNEIYAAGGAFLENSSQMCGVVMRFDGQKWDYVISKTPKTYFYKVLKYGNKLYLGGVVRNYPASADSVGIYEYDGKVLKTVYSDIRNAYNNPMPLLLNNKLYFGFKEKLYVYENGTMTERGNFAGKNIFSMARISGRNENDVFLPQTEGLGHYNGSDLVTVYKYAAGTEVLSWAVFENDAFFLCRDSDLSTFYVLHGCAK